MFTLLAYRHHRRLPCLMACAVGLLCAACFSPGTTASGSSESSTTTSPVSADGSGSTSSSTGSPSTSASTDPDGGSTTATTSSTGDASGTTDDDTGSTTASRPSCNDPTPAEALVFGPAVQLPGINTPGPEDSAWLSPDELTIWVSAQRPEGLGGYDILRGTRDAPTDPFGPLTLLAGVNTTASEREPELTNDTLVLYAISNGAQSMGGWDIMVATRQSTLVDFGALAPVSNINTSSGDVSPFLSADGTEMHFASDRAGTYDIYRTQQDMGGSFAPPVPVGELNALDAHEGSPVLGADGLTIFFQTDRDDPAYDINVATRSTPDDGFGEPVALGETINTAGTEWPIWLSGDGCRLIFGSTRPGEGGYDLWIAEREL